MNSTDAPDEPSVVKRERLFDHHMWWILVLGICGIGIYQMFKYQAFPAASIEIKKPRIEIQEQARAIAPNFGYDKKGTIDSTVFDSDDDAKSFLEHEYPQEEANKLMATEVPVWSWATRFCKEFDQEEFKTWISPQGKLVSFDHEIPNDVARKSVSHEEAKQIALAFMQKTEPDAAKFNTLIRDDAYTKPKREDHSFTWENQSTDYKSAHLRIYVYISGDQITEYSKFLHVPDSWEREYDTMRSYNYLLGQFSFFFIYLFQTLAFLVLVWGVITKNIRWKPAIFGSVLLGGISALDYLNHLPSLIASYGPTTSFNAYLVRIVFNAVIGFIGNALMGASLFGGAEICYRRLFPHKLSFEKILTKKGLTHDTVVRGVIVGHILVGVHLGWIVLYYILGKKFNFWCPLGIESHEVLSNVVPFISAVGLGVSASFEEELACRVVGIALGTRLFKNFWVANLFQAVVWGFAHSSYPQEPSYARGLELTVVGLLQGWIMYRYGIIAVITEHYLLDAFMYVESFLYSDVLMLKLSVVPALIPAVLIVVGALLLNRSKIERGNQFDNDKIPLLEPPPPVAEDVPPPVEYKPLSKRLRINLVVIWIMAILSAVYIPWTNGINSDAKLKIGRVEAIARAKEVMQKHNINPLGWMENAYCGVSGVGDAFQYMFEKTDADIVKKIYNETDRGYYWSVRFFKPMTSEEYLVYLDGEGKETSFDITREEDDVGANLKSDEARALAEKYLKETHPEFPDYKFKQISSQKRKNRTDYDVEFTYPSLKVADANCLISVSVTGDQVGDFSQRWEVPDSWTFERNKRTAKDEWLSHLRSATMFGLILLTIFWAYSVLKTGAIRFRAPIAIAVVYLVVVLISQLNDLVTFFSGYTTTTPLNSYIVSSVVELGQGLFAQGAGIFLLVAVALGAFRIISPRTPLIPYFNFVFGKSTVDAEQKKVRLNMWYDAALIGYTSLAFSMIVGQLQGLVSRAISPSVPVDSIGSIAGLTMVYVPVAEVILDAVKTAPFGLCMVIVIVGMAAKFAPGFFRVFIFGLAIVLIMPSAERYWQDYMISAVYSLLMFLYSYVLIAQLCRTNFLAYIVVFCMYAIAPYAKAIAMNGTALFVPELIAFLGLLVAPTLCVIWVQVRSHRHKSKSLSDIVEES
jgi:hypothetical protein